MFVCPECAESRSDTGFCPNDGSQLLSDGGDGLVGTTIGGFKIAGLLGVGGMGRVYKGVNPTIASRVAIKVLSRDCADNPELVERFFAEARAVNVIRNENIVNVLDLAQLPDRRPYIVMEYLDGSPLSRTIATRGPLPLGSLARLMTEVLSALAAAHEKQIVHRDLKPDNIFITPQGRGKVLDFGIAKLMPEHSGRSGPTRDGSLMGTPHYMSPEQCQARPVDSRTDLYAVGVILYECATGRPPFAAESLFDLLKQHIEVAPAPPRTLRPDLSPQYEAIILRALAKAPEQRWQTAQELAGALTGATHDLAADQWGPLGTAEQASVPSIRSMPTPGGGAMAPGYQATGVSGPPQMTPMPGGPPSGVGVLHATPMPHSGVGQATPMPQAHVGQPTPSASGQMQPRPETTGGRGSKIAVIIGLVALLAGAGIGFAIYQSRKPDSSATAAAGGTDSTASDSGDDDSGKKDDEAAGDESAQDRAQDKGRAKSVAGGSGDKQAEAGDTDNDGAEATTTTTTTIDGSKGLTVKGPVRIIKPGMTEQDTPNPTEFDVTGYLPTAIAAAKAEFSDAVLVRIDSAGVYPNGNADLSLDDGFYVLYRFRSPSRAKRPNDLPQGVEHKPTCLYYVNVTKQTILSYVVEGFSCDFEPLGPPRCSAKQVWEKAIGKGAPSKNAVASLGYWADPKGKPRWLFSIGSEHSHWLPDDC